jgi:fatty acid-binding protein DegV
VRTTGQGNERLSKLLLEGRELERLAILHTGAESRAREFLNQLMQHASQSVPRDILMVNVTTVIGTHVGPNGLGFAAIRK